MKHIFDIFDGPPSLLFPLGPLSMRRPSTRIHVDVNNGGRNLFANRRMAVWWSSRFPVEKQFLREVYGCQKQAKRTGTVVKLMQMQSLFLLRLLLCGLLVESESWPRQRERSSGSLLDRNTLFSNATHKCIVTSEKTIWHCIILAIRSTESAVQFYSIHGANKRCSLKYTRVANAERFCAIVPSCWAHSVVLLRRKSEIKGLDRIRYFPEILA